MNENLKEQLGNLLSKPAKSAPAETPAVPVSIDCGVVTEPEPTPSGRELDKLISTPVQPNCGGCMSPMTKTPQGGWICEVCREKALKAMTGVSATPVAEPVAPSVPSTIGIEMETLRRTIFEHATAMKTAALGLLKINGEDYIAKTFLDRSTLILYELDGIYGIRAGNEPPEKPAAYQASEGRVPRSGNDAIRDYSAPNPVSYWGRR